MSIGCSVQTILMSPDCFPFQNLLFLFSFLLIEHRTPLIIWDFDGFSLFLLWLTAEAELIYWCYTTTLRIMCRAAASACSASRSRCCASARTRWPDISTLELETKVHPKVRNHGEGPYYRAFSWLKAATTVFTFKTLRHYAKRALTPR